MEVGLGPSHIVLDGDPAPLPKRGIAPPQFLAHVSCAQTAGWIKMPFGMEVDLGSGHIVSDEAQLPLERETAAPLFLAHVYCGQTVAHLSYC